MYIIPQNIVDKRFKHILKRRNLVRNRKVKGLQFNYLSLKVTTIIRMKIRAPKHFNYLQNPLDCNYFFNQLRRKDLCSFNKDKPFYKICLRGIEDIDFAAISILKSIMEEARLSGISFSGSLPKDSIIKGKLIDFGFLNNLDYEGKDKIEIESHGQYFSYLKKSGKMTETDYKNIDDISEKAYEYLMGTSGFFDEIITMLKEIGTNAVEWAHSKNKQWMIGFFKKDEKVIINVIDLGSGILDSLFVERRLQLIDLFLLRGSDKILARAFQQKYGSFSQEINRNKGLPFIKATFDDKKIKNLIVSTNNIFYNFENNSNSKISNRNGTNFYGTFYQMEIDKSCVEYYGK